MYALHHATTSPPVYGAVRSHTRRAYVCFALTCHLPPVSEQWYMAPSVWDFSRVHILIVLVRAIAVHGAV